MNKIKIWENKAKVTKEKKQKINLKKKRNDMSVLCHYAETTKVNF